MIIALFLAFGQPAAEQSCPGKIAADLCDSIMHADVNKMIGATIALKAYGGPQTCDRTDPECKNKPPYDYASDTNLVRYTRVFFSTYELWWFYKPEVRATMPDTIKSGDYALYATKETLLKIGMEDYIATLDRREINGPSAAMPNLSRKRLGSPGLRFNVKGQKIRKAEKRSVILLQPPASAPPAN